MDDQAAGKILSVIIAVAAAGAAALGFVYFTFPVNAIILGVAIAIITFALSFLEKKEKAAQLKLYYSAVNDLGGMPLYHKGYETAFERNGVRFEITFPQGRSQLFFQTNFFVPDLKERFSIRNSMLGTSYFDCPKVESAAFPEDFYLHSRNPEFLENLLQNQTIANAIRQHTANYWEWVQITCDDGNFEMRWAPSMSDSSNPYNMMASTAVAFSDELIRLSKKLPQ